MTNYKKIKVFFDGTEPHNTVLFDAVATVGENGRLNYWNGAVMPYVALHQFDAMINLLTTPDTIEHIEELKQARNKTIIVDNVVYVDVTDQGLCFIESSATQTLEQWRNTRRAVTPEQFELNPDTALGYDDPRAYANVTAMHVYDDLLAIEERRDGTYNAQVLGEEFQSRNLCDVECWLYYQAATNL